MKERITIQAVDKGWNKVFVGFQNLGGFGETTYANDELRWYWSGNGSFGHCATRGEAIDALCEQVPSFLERKAAEKAREIEFAALPEHLQALKVEMDWAEVERQRVWGRNPFDQVDYASAFDRSAQANVAFQFALDEWKNRKEAA